MDKKQRISWGVSFGSLALVAGMVSYLGLTNGDKSNNQGTMNQGLPFNNQPSQNGQWPGDANSNSNFNFGNDNSSQFGDDGSGNLDNSDGSFQQNQDPFSNGNHNFRQHDGFDTTTGGT